MWVRIGDTTFQALIDSGGSYAFLSRDMYDVLCYRNPEIDKIRLDAPIVPHVQCANGTMQQVFGALKRMRMTIGAPSDEPLTVAGPVTLYGDLQVVDGQPVPLLIGGDVLGKNGIAIDYWLRLLYGFAEPPKPKEESSPGPLAADRSTYAGRNANGDYLADVMAVASSMRFMINARGS